ncbi:MAG: hypothetical protein U1F53_25315 [Burkholderiaceae bacterium]
MRLRWLAALLLSGAAVWAAAGTTAPAVERASAGPCVAAPDVMRREHMEMLRHQRERTVHLGERGAKASLQGCIGCHASTKTGSVAASEGDFCVACHRYAAVQVDCFECHSSRPAAKTALLEAKP